MQSQLLHSSCVCIAQCKKGAKVVTATSKHVTVTTECVRYPCMAECTWMSVYCTFALLCGHSLVCFSAVCGACSVLTGHSFQLEKEQHSASGCTILMHSCHRHSYLSGGHDKVYTPQCGHRCVSVEWLLHVSAVYNHVDCAHFVFSPTI